MKLRRLLVKHFRGVAAAELEFGRGLNVIYGPNDLGKSTLAEAIRAALLLPAGSSAGEKLRPWNHDHQPEVVLEFEDHEGRFWRVKKTFGGRDRAGFSELDGSRDGSQWTLEKSGRGVDGKLVQLMGWGIPEPGGSKKGSGGKGAKRDGRGVPTSFLARAFLGEQADADHFLGRSLAEDPSEDARERLVQTLGSYAREPELAHVLNLAQARVDKAFTATGRRRSAKDSPWKARKDELAEARKRVEELEGKREQSDRVEEAVTRLLAEDSAARDRVDTLSSRQEALTTLQRQVDALRGAYAEWQRAQELHAQVGRARREADAAAAAEAEARAAHESARESLAAAESARAAADDARCALAEEGESVAMFERSERTRALERAQDELAKLAVRAEKVAEAEVQAAELARLEGSYAAASAELTAARETEAAAVAAEERETLLARVDALLADEARLAELRQAARASEAAAAVAAGVTEEAARARKEASRLRSAAERAFTEADLEKLRVLARERDAASAALAVGLSVAVLRDPEVTIRAEVDGEPLDGAHDRSLALEARAQVRLVLERAGTTLAEIEISGGDAAAARRQREAEAAWTREGAPILAGYALGSIAEAEASRAQALRDLADAQAHEHTAAQADLRADHQRAEAAQLAPLPEELAALTRSLAEASERECAVMEERRGAARTPQESAAAREAAAEARRQAERVRIAAAHGVESIEAERTRIRAELARRVHALREAPPGGPAQLALGLGPAEGEARADEPDPVLERDAAALRTAVDSLREALDADLKIGQEARERAARSLAALDEAGADRVQTTQASFEEAERVAAKAASELEQRATALRVAGERYGDLRGRLSVAEERASAIEPSEIEARARALLVALSAVGSEVPPALLAWRRNELDDLDGLELEEAAREIGAAGEELRRELEEAAGALARIDRELQQERGALRQVGGNVLRDELEDAEAALAQAERRGDETAIEYEGWQLLVQTLEQVEEEEGGQLGQALAAQLTPRFGALLEHAARGASEETPRYQGVRLAPDFGESKILHRGHEQEIEELSMGTREQLAALMRVQLAELLSTFCVLDDQLTHTDPTRLRWFSQQLRAAAHRTQVLVLTCHPAAYLEYGELASAETRPFVERAAGLVRALDAERLITRARE